MPDDIFSTLYPPQRNVSAFPAEISYAMAYIPFQKLDAMYEPDAAFRAGTLFPDLDKPFLGGRRART